MEIKYAIRPEGVKYVCDKCNAGTMNATGLIAPSQPPKHEHVCSNCGERALLDKQYPHVTFNEVEQDIASNVAA